MHWTSFAGTDNAFAMCSAPVGPILLPDKSIFWIVLFSYQIKKGVLSLTKESATDILSSILEIWFLCLYVYLKCNFLQTNNILQILSLSNNKIGDEGATAIGHALQVPLVPWQCVLLLWDLFRCNPSELLEPFRLPKFTSEENMRRKKNFAHTTDHKDKMLPTR